MMEGEGELLATDPRGFKVMCNDAQYENNVGILYAVQLSAVG